jgi:hypothetical protein
MRPLKVARIMKNQAVSVSALLFGGLMAKIMAAVRAWSRLWRSAFYVKRKSIRKHSEDWAFRPMPSPPAQWRCNMKPVDVIAPGYSKAHLEKIRQMQRRHCELSRRNGSQSTTHDDGAPSSHGTPEEDRAQAHSWPQ